MDVCKQQAPTFAEVAPGHRVACFAVNPVAVM